MLHAPVQSMFIQPRAGKDPRIAKTDDSHLGVGSDGILYKMLDQRDWDKFRTMTDRELQGERDKSREIKENMNILTGKLKNGKYSGSLSKSGIKLVAPQFGTQSRTKKIERKNWEADLKTMQSGGDLGKSLRTDADFLGTMQTLARNEQLNHSDRYEEEYDREESPPPQRFRNADGGLNVSQSADDRIQAAIHTMKNKYEQNLHVVEQLFDEKKYMERKIELLEEKLRGSTSGRLYDDHEYEAVETSHLLREENARLNATYGEVPPERHAVRGLQQSEYEPELRSYGASKRAADPSHGHRASAPSRPRPVGEETYSAADLADLLHSRPETRASTGSRPLSAPARRPPSGATRDSVSRGRSRGRSSTPLGNSQTVRSSSATSRRSIGGGVSANLQADADRYIQKRRMLEEQERAKKLEDERYEQSLKERALRASMNGKGFPEMLKRQAAAEEASQARMAKIKAEQLQKEQEERDRRKLEVEAKRKKLAQDAKNQLSWSELQKIQEETRRDRIERHKQKLAQESALPNSLAESLKRVHREPPVESKVPAGANEFRAEDPAKVLAKLEHAQKAWDLRMEREREKIQMQKAARAELAAKTRMSMSGTGTGQDDEECCCGPKSAMDLRNEQYAKKRAAAVRARKEREEEAERLKKQQEEEKRQKLLNQKVPIGKPTNAAILKAEKVRNDKLREQEEQRRMRETLRKKEISAKQASVVIKTIINEREHERRGGHGGYMELSAAQPLAAQKAAEARAQYKQQLKTNQDRIQNSLSNRKSLMERHDTGIAVNKATQAALQKFAGAVGVSTTGSRGTHTTARTTTTTSTTHVSSNNALNVLESSGVEFFDAREQVRLGLRTL
eukprot:CAMPEP_0184969002 /NCGR_PEP_ID=MMETSP1098-20130426/1892_1 /TAXON_ID=89044 /ORGANISM="Spumella elongata, Strain CCAP 955/1" /LENGTH=852 /DNA_ID=CAMNT_0027490715 /DNA_START=65 /DNA_END=2623 /DNA_ORIENTATION=+